MTEIEIDKRAVWKMWAVGNDWGGVICLPTEREAMESAGSENDYYIGPVTITFGHETDKIRDTWCPGIFGH